MPRKVERANTRILKIHRSIEGGPQLAGVLSHRLGQKNPGERMEISIVDAKDRKKEPIDEQIARRKGSPFVSEIDR